MITVKTHQEYGIANINAPNNIINKSKNARNISN